MAREILPLSFFDRDTVQVAKSLLNACLVRRYRGETKRYKITEVEAYDGFHDRASHASRGKTLRNAPMWGKAGHWYVYFTYGMHFILNIVTREEGYPGAVLIRGTQEISGPARLTKNLHIDKKLNGKPASMKSGLWIEKGKRLKEKIYVSPRIGVSSAGKFWANKKWRFFIGRF